MFTYAYEFVGQKKQNKTIEDNPVKKKLTVFPVKQLGFLLWKQESKEHFWLLVLWIGGGDRELIPTKILD